MYEHQPRGLAGYLRIEESLYGEQLISLLLQQTQIGHDVVLTDPCGGAQRVLDHRAVTLHCGEGAFHPCGTRERGKTLIY